jgi:hypothetical protein
MGSQAPPHRIVRRHTRVSPTHPLAPGVTCGDTFAPTIAPLGTLRGHGEPFATKAATYSITFRTIRQAGRGYSRARRPSTRFQLDDHLERHQAEATIALHIYIYAGCDRLHPRRRRVRHDRRSARRLDS